MKEQPAGPVAAVIVEPMQGTAGNVIPPPEFVKAMSDAAHEMGALFIADEMITGFGRTGRPWGVDHSGAQPDIATVGKGFGSGFPISGVLARDEISRAKPWSNPSGASSSYGGNALAAAAALAAVGTVRDERLWENSASVGAAMLAELERMKERYPFVGHVSGSGLFLGIELVKDRQTKEPVDVGVMKDVYSECVQRGLLAMSYTPHVRLQPALTIDRETALEGLAILDEVFRWLVESGRWR
jgi:4-aminobutyrate aminotransferase-like enzyme